MEAPDCTRHDGNPLDEWEVVDVSAPSDARSLGGLSFSGWLDDSPAGREEVAEVAMPYVPDVKAASWRHPYQFSGRLPFRALALMVGVGVPAALIAGGGGYFGGAVTRWIGIQTTHLSAAVAAWLSDVGLVGNGVAVFVLIFPALMVGIGYPLLIGAVAGSAVASGARVGKCRKPWVAGLLGLLTGGLTYTAFMGTAVLMNAPLHESSRILETVDPPFNYGLMVIDGLLVLLGATMTAAGSYKSPFCESCETWYGTPKTTTIPIEGAPPLVEALASESALPLQAVPIRVTDPARIQLDLSRCECGRSDYNLVTTVHWDELKQDKKDKKGKTSTESKTETWFSTTLPASLGAEIERWSMPMHLPAIPARPAPRREVGQGARLAALMLVLVIVAAGAVLLLPAMGLKLPAFSRNRGLVTATTSEAVSQQATAMPVAEGSRAATELLLSTDTATPTLRPSATPAATLTASLPRAVVTTDTLNVRTGPGTNYPKTRVVRKGVQMVVTGRTEAGDWLAVTLADGKKGWVAASLVKLDVPVASLPVVDWVLAQSSCRTVVGSNSAATAVCCGMSSTSVRLLTSCAKTNMSKFAV